jgi:hypothetical protein
MVNAKMRVYYDKVRVQETLPGSLPLKMRNGTSIEIRS